VISISRRQTLFSGTHVDDFNVRCTRAWTSRKTAAAALRAILAASYRERAWNKPAPRGAAKINTGRVRAVARCACKRAGALAALASALRLLPWHISAVERDMDGGPTTTLCAVSRGHIA